MLIEKFGLTRGKLIEIFRKLKKKEHWSIVLIKKCDSHTKTRGVLRKYNDYTRNVYNIQLQWRIRDKMIEAKSILPILVTDITDE